MKKVLFLSLIVLAAVGVWLYVNHTSAPLSATHVSALTSSSSKPPETNLVVAPSATGNPASVQAAFGSTNTVFNALTATNIEQWRQAVKNLKQVDSSRYHRDWIMEEDNPDRSPDRNASMPFNLILNGQTIEYKATVIYITTKDGTDNLMEAQLQTPNMNIDEAKQLGLQLCKMLGQDPSRFSAWCGKVGNHWMDAPLFSTPSNRQLSFKILQTFNNEKPWCIDFIIQ
jgi:hypothetical protein